MARFKIVTTAGPGTGVPGADHSLEMEALAAIGAEIVEVKGGEDELAAAAVDADAIYGKGRPRITAKVINAGKKLKVVSLASVGVDSSCKLDQVAQHVPCNRVAKASQHP